MPATTGPSAGARRQPHSSASRATGAASTLIVTAKLGGADPLAWLYDVLARIPKTPMNRLDELLPWNRIADQQRPYVKAA